MKYRLLEVADLYDAYVQQLGCARDDMSYEQLHRRVLDDCYSESDYIHRYLREDYDLDTMHIYYNYQDLQRRWDDEEDKDSFSILLRQIKAFQPDVILVLNLWFFTVDQINVIRNTLKKEVHFVCYHFTAIDEHVKKVFKEYEIVFTGSNYWAKVTGEFSNNVVVVRHAFEPGILHKIGAPSRSNRVCFAGSIMLGGGVHTNRIDLLSAFRKNEIDFDYYGKIYGSLLGPRNFVKNITTNPKKYLERIKTSTYVKRICRPSVFGLTYYKTLQNYAINLNIHAEVAASGAGNQRMFEVTGVGSCLITDYRDENVLLFEEGKEIVVFRNEDELVDKVKFLLQHPDVADKIGEEGQKRTIKDHNYRNKAHSMHEYILKVL